MQRLFVVWLAVVVCGGCHSERLGLRSPATDRIVFVEDPDEYAARLKGEDAATGEMEMAVDLSAYDIPDSTSQFKQAWHQQPICQDLTGTCWAFAATSFFESEVYRLSQRQVKLSEMYTVYWECVEKVRHFVRQKGEFSFGRGSQPNAVVRIWKQYGIVPAEAYSGRLEGQTHYADKPVHAVMTEYLNSLKQSGQWDEQKAIEELRAILDKHMGSPPSTLTVDGRTMTPREYLTDYLRLKMDDYVDVMSLADEPFGSRREYEVYDNWWHADQYLNLSLDKFVEVIREAARRGYTVCMAGDTSEPGYRSHYDVAVVPSFDITPKHIDNAARLMRFENGATSDDHVVHLVGYAARGGRTWYLIKDSETRAYNGRHQGYMFFDEEYIKLKMMNLLVHKDVVGRQP